MEKREGSVKSDVKSHESKDGNVCDRWEDYVQRQRRSEALGTGPEEPAAGEIQSDGHGDTARNTWPSERSAAKKI